MQFNQISIVETNTYTRFYSSEITTLPRNVLFYQKLVIINILEKRNMTRIRTRCVICICSQKTKVYFEGGYRETDVYQLPSLSAGQVIDGPAIIMDSLSTILIEPGCSGLITTRGNIKIKIGAGLKSKVSTDLDMIQLSIFSHRFMSIAEQMGRYTRMLYAVKIKILFEEKALYSSTKDIKKKETCAFCTQNPAKDVHIDEHKGAIGFLLRRIRSRWRTRLKRTPYSRSPWRHARDGAVSDKGFQRYLRAWRHDTLQSSVGRWLAFARPHRHHSCFLQVKFSFIFTAKHFSFASRYYRSMRKKDHPNGI